MSKSNLCSTNHRLVSTSGGGGKRKSRGRGSRQALRNLEAASKKSSIRENSNKSALTQPRTAFMILGVLPLVATGTMVVLRDDLREDLKSRWRWEN